MLNGAAVMDVALLVISGSETCPQPQTMEHLAAADIMGLNHIVVVQNKIDVIDKERALKNFEEIKNFVTGTAAEKSKIIPTSAQLGVNIDALLQYIVENVPEPQIDLSLPPRMIAIRSFDVNKPGAIDNYDNLKGAIIGGSLERGVLRLGQKLEIRPGLMKRDKQTGKEICVPLITTVVSLSSEKTALTEARPGGLIGVGTLIDPSLGKGDGLVGQVLGPPGSLPCVYQELELDYRLMSRAIGSSEVQKISRMKEGEKVLLNVGSLTTRGLVKNIKKKANQRLMTVSLEVPVCADIGQKCAVSRRIEDSWRLIGWGKITPASVILPIGSI